MKQSDKVIYAQGKQLAETMYRLLYLHVWFDTSILIFSDFIDLNEQELAFQFMKSF